MVGLIIIGDEILSGRRQDKHLVKAIELLNERGMALQWVRYVGDDPERITADIRHAVDSGDVVFSFGGIGATPDDHTRGCAARAVGQELRLHPEARELILARSREVAEQEGRGFDPESPDTQRRLQMGFFPEDAEIIPNPYNRIPGFSLLGLIDPPGEVVDGEVKFKGMVTPKTKLVEYGIDFKRVMRGRLVLGTADGWLKADGETIYQASDLRVGLSKEKTA